MIGPCKCRPKLKVMPMTKCAYPICENESEFQCIECHQYFCAFHIYDRGGYICKNDYEEIGMDVFTPGHRSAPSRQGNMQPPNNIPPFFKWLERLFGHKRD